MINRKRILIALLCVLWIGLCYYNSRSQNPSSDRLHDRTFYGEVVGYEPRQNDKLLILKTDHKLNEYRFIINEDVICAPELEVRISNSETGFFVRIVSEYLPSEAEKEWTFPATTIEAASPLW